MNIGNSSRFGDFLYVWWRWRGSNGKDVEWLPSSGRNFWLRRIVKDIGVRSRVKDFL